MTDLTPQTAKLLSCNPERTIEVPHDMAEIVTSDRPGFIAFNYRTWSPDAVEYFSESEVPAGIKELKAGQWVSIHSHRNAVTEALVKIDGFETIEPPCFAAKEREEFWSGQEIRGRKAIE